VAGTKTRFHVTCRDGSGQWWLIPRVSEVRRLCMRDRSFLNTLLAAAKKIPTSSTPFGHRLQVRGKGRVEVHGWKKTPIRAYRLQLRIVR
jgi:hypothetical protein